MAVDFKNSETKENLMRAFAGESQARNRYTFAAEVARKQKQYAMSQVFLYTANQELAHAKVFYDHLKELSGQTITVDGTYPVDQSESLSKLLRMAQHNEYEEHDDVYRKFGETARAEGFLKVAASFEMIGSVEKHHGDRFSKFAELLETNELYVSKEKKQWVCLNCGYIYEGESVPPLCPVCRHDQGFFVPVELAPLFTPEHS